MNETPRESAVADENASGPGDKQSLVEKAAIVEQPQQSESRHEDVEATSAKKPPSCLKIVGFVLSIAVVLFGLLRVFVIGYRWWEEDWAIRVPATVWHMERDNPLEKPYWRVVLKLDEFGYRNRVLRLHLDDSLRDVTRMEEIVWDGEELRRRTFRVSKDRTDDSADAYQLDISERPTETVRSVILLRLDSGQLEGPEREWAPRLMMAMHQVDEKRQYAMRVVYTTFMPGSPTEEFADLRRETVALKVEE